MALFPHAPKVSLRAPPVVVGQPCTIELLVTAADETRVEFVRVRVRGRQGWAIGSGNDQISVRATVPDLESQVMGEGVLPARESSFLATFTLPPGTAPSHSLRPAYAYLELKIHVSIPWWPDGRYRFVLPVRLPPPPGPLVRTPIAMRSTATDAPADKPRLELGLASTRLVAGETVVGSCAVFHLDDKKPRKVELLMVPMLALRGRGSRRSRDGMAIHVAEVMIPAGGAGTSVPFRFDVPAAITPSFETVSHELMWSLVARTGSLFGTRLSLAAALEIVDAAAAAASQPLTVAPRVADERTAAVFAGFAARAGWRAVREDDDRPDADSIVIVREHGDAELRLGYAYRGEDGTFLIARIAHRPLGLGLHVSPGSTLRHVFFHDVEVGVDPWDREHLVTARAADQAVPFLRAVVPALVSAAPIGTMVRWDDDGLQFERPVASVEDRHLVEIAGLLEPLAAAIAAAEAAIAPPPGLTVDLPAWAELARWLRGRLSVGDLSIDGRLDDRPVELGLRFDPTGAVTGLVAQVGSAVSAGAGSRDVSFSLPRPAADALGNPDAEPLLALLAAWPTDVVDLRVAGGVAAATWRVGAGAVDATRVRQLVESLAAVLVALAPGAGPYR